MNGEVVKTNDFEIMEFMSKRLHELSQKKYADYKKTIKTKTGWLYYNSPQDYFFEYDAGGIIVRNNSELLIAIDGEKIYYFGNFKGMYFIEPKKVATKRKTVLHVGSIDDKNIYIAPFSRGIFMVMPKHPDCLDANEHTDCNPIGTIVEFPTSVPFKKAEVISEDQAIYDDYILPLDDNKLRKIFAGKEDVIASYGFSII